MDKKTKLIILILAAAVLLSVLALALIGRDGHIAAIYIDGELYKKIDLRYVFTSQDIRIETEWGYNIIRIENGSIRIVEADCPGHDCVRQGTLSSPGIPIICMPHRLSIIIEGGDIDA